MDVSRSHNKWKAPWVCGADHFVKITCENQKRNVWGVIEKVLLFLEMMRVLCSLDPKSVNEISQMIGDDALKKIPQSRINDITAPPDFIQEPILRTSDVIEVKDADEELKEMIKAHQEAQNRMKGKKEKTG